MLSFSLSGDGEIDLMLVAKKPGPALDTEEAQAAIPLSSLPGADPLPPYVRLIHDVILGDRSLFTRPDGLAAVWKVASHCSPTRRGSSPIRRGPGDRRRPVTSSPRATGCWASNAWPNCPSTSTVARTLHCATHMASPTRPLCSRDVGPWLAVAAGAKVLKCLSRTTSSSASPSSRPGRG